MTCYVTVRPYRLKRQAGFALLELIVALIVLCAAAPLIISYIMRQNDQAANRVVVSQMKRIGEGVAAYVAANYESLSKSRPGPQTVDWDTLALYVSTGIGTDSPNPFGLRYRVQARVVTVPKSANRVEAVVYAIDPTGKRPLDVPSHAMPIAQALGAGGVYLDYHNRREDERPAYWGGYGELGDQGLLPNFFTKNDLPKTRGTIFYLVSPLLVNQLHLGEKDTLDESKFLHRKRDSDHPEYSAMLTDFDMNSNRINDVTRISFDNDGVKSDQGKFQIWQRYGNLVIAPKSNSASSSADIETNLDVSKKLTVHGGIDMQDGNIIQLNQLSFGAGWGAMAGDINISKQGNGLAIFSNGDPDEAHVDFWSNAKVSGNLKVFGYLTPPKAYHNGGCNSPGSIAYDGNNYYPLYCYGNYWAYAVP